MDKWLNKAKWGPDGTRIKTVDSNWKKLERWDKRLDNTGLRERVFIASLADVFEKNDDISHWRFDMWDIIERLKNLDILLLTKRPENILDCTPYTWHNQAVTDQTAHWERGPIIAKWPTYVWTGTSIENQKVAKNRLSELVRVPGKHFLSLEPLLGPIDLNFDSVDWVIIGGESGPNARPLDVHWILDILDQCRSANIPAFVKQLGRCWARRTGAKDSKGGEPGEWPPELRVRMFPGKAWSASRNN
jgi:protein gp37